MEVESSPSPRSWVSDPRIRKGCVTRWSSVFLRQAKVSGSFPRPYAIHLLSDADSDFSESRPLVSRTSTPCRGSCTDARVTPEAVDGSVILSSPVADATGMAISSNKSARPAWERSAESWLPALLLAPGTRETSLPSSLASRTRRPAGIGTRTQPSFKTSTVKLARSEEHTSELQSQSNLVCRLLLEKKKHT